MLPESLRRVRDLRDDLVKQRLGDRLLSMRLKDLPPLDFLGDESCLCDSGSLVSTTLA